LYLCRTESPLQAAISNSQERGGGGGASGGSGMHPALRLRTDDAANFFDDDIQTFDNKSGSSGYGARSQASYGTESKTSGRGAESKASGCGAEWDQYEAALGSNLGMLLYLETYQGILVALPYDYILYLKKIVLLKWISVTVLYLIMVSLSFG